MSGQDILGQDEIDALMRGVQGGAIEAPPEPLSAEGETRGYDFGRSVRIIRGRMPTLEMINERFAPYAEDVPVFRGVYGQSGGQHALQVSERVARARPGITPLLQSPGELS
jgi:flagellar motor switch protein FliM